MAEWLLNRLFENELQKPQFARLGALNWMRALAIIVVDSGDFEETALRHRYAAVQRRSPNVTADNGVFESLLMAIHNVACLASINKHIDDRYDVVRSAIVDWYYCMYFASSAMVLSASGANPQTHRSTSRVWQNDIVTNGLAIGPFRLFLDSLVKADVEAQIKKLSNGNCHNLVTRPTSLDEAWGCLYRSLNGTAIYEREREEEKIKSLPAFKKLGVSNFRTKAARQVRDHELSQCCINFVIQAIRYRGKANYRDSIYLSYGDDWSEKINEFTMDLEIVARAYLRMASQYANRRVEKGTWKAFTKDLEARLRINADLSLLGVDA